MASARFDLIIFDCDGVLIDSEVISTHTLLETLAAHGLGVDISYVRANYLGRSLSTVQSDFARLTGQALPKSFEGEFLQRLFSAYRRELRPMTDVREAIAAIDGSYCMATSSGFERATMSLEVTGLAPLFKGRIFSASMVTHGKPAPDLFLFAAKSLSVSPDRCLVIEDSEVGISAGLNAGMTVWRFVGGSHFESGQDIALAHKNDVRVFHHMREIAAALRPN